MYSSGVPKGAQKGRGPCIIVIRMLLLVIILVSSVVSMRSLLLIHRVPYA